MLECINAGVHFNKPYAQLPDEAKAVWQKNSPVIMAYTLRPSRKVWDEVVSQEVWDEVVSRGIAFAA